MYYKKRRPKPFTGAIVALSALSLLCIAAILFLLLSGGNLMQSAMATATPGLSPQITKMPEATQQPLDVSPAPDDTQSGKAKLQLCGDILLHDTSRESGKKEDGSYNYSSYFSIISKYLDGDFVLANMESPIDVNNGSGYSGYPTFNMPREIVTASKEAGIDFFFTSNNHAADKGKSGIVKSHDNLKEMGIDFTGTYTSQEEYDAPVIREINGIKIGIIAYTYGVNGMFTKSNAGYYIRMFDQESKNTEDLARMKKDIDNTRAAGAEFILFYMHWGAEYTYTPSAVERWYAQNLAEYGVDVLMGCHSHCVQNIRNLTVQIDGKPHKTLIIYSLGNFFADQIALSTKKTTDDRIRQAMIVSLWLEKGADGTVSIADACYTPTFIHRDTLSGGSSPIYAYRILPAGVCATQEVRPDVFENDEKWQLCKNAWKTVPSAVGNEIRCSAE